MKLTCSLLLGATVLLSPLRPGYAESCAGLIAQTASQIDARLHSVAEAGADSIETFAATLHRQPTPRSIADAEARIGDLSAEVVEIVEGAMARARNSESLGQEYDCIRAVRDARRAIGD
jgi:hypothetical protein